MWEAGGLYEIELFLVLSVTTMMKRLFLLFLQLALPQLVAGAQFPFNFAAGATAPHMAGFYYPQPMAAAQAAAAQTNYLQGLQGYTFNNFGASFPQGYIRYVVFNFIKKNHIKDSFLRALREVAPEVELFLENHR